MTALLTADEVARLTLGVNVIVRPGDLFAGGAATGDVFVAPQDWVALTGPCPTCGGSGLRREMLARPCPDCRDGRRVVPLYTECPECHGDGIDGSHDAALYYAYSGKLTPCDDCNNGRVLVGQGSIEVAPVGRDFGVVIDVTELA